MRVRLLHPIALLLGLGLIAAACGDASTAGTVDADLLATPETTVAATLAQAPTTVPPTTVPPTTMAMHDDEMDHEDEAGEHEEEASHDEAAEHDEAADHDEAAEHDEAASGDFDREIEVVMTEFAFEPAAISVTAGETVRFVLVNQGVVPHEFRLTTAHAAAEHVASGHEGHGDDGGDAGHGHDEMLLEVAAGATDHLIVTFAEDADWDQVACLIPGHYEAGMLAELEIS